MEITNYLSIEGVTQGEIEGACIHEGFEGKTAILSFVHEVSIPSVLETTAVGAKPAHAPILIEKEVDKASPKLYQAFFSSEKLTTVLLEWYRFDNGKSQMYFKIELLNALICKIASNSPNVYVAQQQHYRFFEQISFVYEQITWSSGASGEVLHTQNWLEKV